MLATVPEAADLLDVDTTTVRSWIRSGQLASIKIGSRILLHLSDLKQFGLDEQAERLPVFLEMQQKIRSLQGRVDRAEASKAEAQRALTEERADMERRELALGQEKFEALTGDATRLPLRGFHVYILRDDAGEVAYVGQSVNVYSRMGSHLNRAGCGDAAVTGEVIRCESKQGMDALERALIRRYRPPFNASHNGTVLNPSATRRPA